MVAVHGGPRSGVVAELVRQARSFARSGLLLSAGRPLGVETEPASPSGPSPVPADPCAHSNRFGWVGGLSVVVGDHVLGVRCNDTDLLALLNRMFAPVAADLPDPEPNFSVRLRQPGRAHRLQEGCRALVHSRSLERVVSGLCSALSVYTEQRRDDGVLLDAVAVVRQDAAIVVPERLRPRLAGAEQHLADRGLALADALPLLSLDGGTLTIPPPSVAVDAAAMAQLSHVAPEPGAPMPVASPGTYRLAGWAWPRPSSGGALTGAYVATAANRAVRNRHAVGAGHALTALAGALAGTDVVPLPVGSVPTGHVLDVIATVG